MTIVCGAGTPALAMTFGDIGMTGGGGKTKPPAIAQSVRVLRGLRAINTMSVMNRGRAVAFLKNTVPIDTTVSARTGHPKRCRVTPPAMLQPVSPKAAEPANVPKTNAPKARSVKARLAALVPQ